MCAAIPDLWLAHTVFDLTREGTGAATFVGLGGSNFSACRPAGRRASPTDASLLLVGPVLAARPRALCSDGCKLLECSNPCLALARRTVPCDPDALVAGIWIIIILSLNPI